MSEQLFLLKITSITSSYEGKFITGADTFPDVREKARLHPVNELSDYDIALQRGYLVAIPTVPFEPTVDLEVPYEPIED